MVGREVSQISLSRDLAISRETPTMKQPFNNFQQTVAIAFLVVAMLSLGVFVTGYAGRLLFILSPIDGIRLEIDGGDSQQ